MKRICALLILAVMITALVPALADTRYESHYCRVCGTVNNFAVCDDWRYEPLDANNHAFYRQDNAKCTVCGMELYNADWPPYMEPHNFVNDVCTACGYDRDNSKRLVFICSDSARVRSEPGGGTIYKTARFGETYTYTNLIVSGNDGDPWFEVMYNGMPAYIPAGTLMSSGSFWSYRRACRIKYYTDTKYLVITEDTNLVKCPDSCTGENEKTAVEVFSGWGMDCYGEVVDELFPGRVWYLVKFDNAWYFVPKGASGIY